jgi:nicotinamide-nucleotide amidase
VRCEIIGVGTELLLGQIVNTNAAWIGGRLADIGWDSLRQTVVGDNEGRIGEAVREAIGRADAVIVTGGLGPTQDDVTRESLAAVAGVELIRDPSIEDWLRDRFARFRSGGMPAMNLRQADVPKNARTIDNPRGTAPGLAMEIDGTPVYAVPGVPREMEHMLDALVLPELSAKAGEGRAIVSRTLKTVGVGESRIAERLTPTWDEASAAASAAGGGNVNLAYLAGAGEVRVRLSVAAPDRATALAAIEPVEAAVRAELGDVVYGVDDDTLESVCAALLTRQGRTLATGESLTGGLLSGRITSLAGASDFFVGGACTYTAAAKTAILGVPPVLLDAAGQVSEAVAAAMAEGARDAFGADVGLATTGVAGPTELEGRAPGTVCLAVADEAGAVTRSINAPGDRIQVRNWTTAVALDLLRRRLLGLA